MARKGGVLICRCAMVCVVLISASAFAKPACASFNMTSEGVDIYAQAFMQQFQTAITVQTAQTGVIDGLQACGPGQKPDLRFDLVFLDPFAGSSQKDQMLVVSIVAIGAGQDFTSAHLVSTTGTKNTLSAAREMAAQVIKGIENMEGPSWRYLLWEHANKDSANQ
jgi:hypothetical protein